jgi:hypothetical protein
MLPLKQPAITGDCSTSEGIDFSTAASSSSENEHQKRILARSPIVAISRKNERAWSVYAATIAGLLLILFLTGELLSSE